jgi:hypothetical protein
MSSRALMLATLILFVNGCDYAQKKPETAPATVASWSGQTSVEQGQPALGARR